MKKQTLFILCGEAFSGKSTLAKKIADHYKSKIIGRDEIYFATEKILTLENTPSEDDESLWNNLWPIVLQGAKNHLLLGNSVVIDDNCLYLKQRDELRKIAKEIGVKTILVHLDMPKELLKERKQQNKISKTRHDVPSSWMDEDSQLFERPEQSENPVVYTQDDIFEILTTKLK